MAITNSGSRGRGSGRRHVTAQLVVDAAERLTADRGLQGWSIRQLAAELDVWPTVIYHHVGDREAVMDAVTARVVGRIPCPEVDTPWRDWFRTVLVEGRRVVRSFPGVAFRLAQKGPVTDSALPLIDRGVEVLTRAGFGSEAPAVFSILMNGAFFLVAWEDEHHATPVSYHRLTSFLRSFRGDGARPGLAAMGEYVDQVPAGDMEAFHGGHHSLLVDVLLDGAAARLTTRQGGGEEVPAVTG
ncbi:transcriptional regulator, TetR family [Streptoalloteichus tenebrarius]|uniref:Transcriptional regulator, TetR family n=1 Tax=Streptoalloteichus tenebrarius (strain ATCC 17920 / DSM 40477 / JCM 4838 / CBS 697.72 / NBRC 16177 / NCIMB 11028 / NRRL B-12390 / A12253. 1 / ISP 5477) TaxID=1933 RepID=A0ABT1I3V8_STRSD|nr:TetR family transcriptional regulator [Streptoalloteichus tenebrarius]MCP2262435.1 transcriptional regulator, TetR family [Streptoalloteichus tenebrarius]BFF00794.1 TetR family transcriptional regulator [Streptoalloteichus tenebrarius]